VLWSSSSPLSWRRAGWGRPSVSLYGGAAATSHVKRRRKLIGRKATGRNGRPRGDAWGHLGGGRAPLVTAGGLSGAHAPVEELAPAPIVVPACLRAARQASGGRDHAVVGSPAHGRVGLAPVHVEDLAGRVRVGLAARAVQPSDRWSVREIVGHAILCGKVRADLKVLLWRVVARG